MRSGEGRSDGEEEGEVEPCAGGSADGQAISTRSTRVAMFA